MIGNRLFLLYTMSSENVEEKPVAAPKKEKKMDGRSRSSAKNLVSARAKREVKVSTRKVAALSEELKKHKARLAPKREAMDAKLDAVEEDRNRQQFLEDEPEGDEDEEPEMQPAEEPEESEDELELVVKPKRARAPAKPKAPPKPKRAAAPKRASRHKSPAIYGRGAMPDDEKIAAAIVRALAAEKEKRAPRPPTAKTDASIFGASVAASGPVYSTIRW